MKLIAALGALALVVFCACSLSYAQEGNFNPSDFFKPALPLAASQECGPTDACIVAFDKKIPVAVGQPAKATVPFADNGIGNSFRQDFLAKLAPEVPTGTLNLYHVVDNSQLSVDEVIKALGPNHLITLGQLYSVLQNEPAELSRGEKVAFVLDNNNVQRMIYAGRSDKTGEWYISDTPLNYSLQNYIQRVKKDYSAIQTYVIAP